MTHAALLLHDRLSQIEMEISSALTIVTIDQMEVPKSFRLDRRIFTVKNETLWFEFIDDTGIYAVLKDQGQ